VAFQFDVACLKADGQPRRHIINSTTLCELCDRQHNSQVITGDNAARRAEDIAPETPG
jgi:hypothetical protein